MLYLYAILEAPGPRGGFPDGIGGGSLEFVDAEGLACAVSVIDSAMLAPEPEQVLRHQQVVDALMERQPVLPLRFGTLAQDVCACQRLLAHRGADLRAQFDRVRDRVEYAVRITGLPEPAAPDEVPGRGPGAAYLRQIARRARGWPASNAAFPHDSLAHHAAEKLLWPRSDAQPDLRASFLVARDKAADFLADVAAFQRLRPDLGLSVTGPWPPYSFSDPNLSGALP